MLTSIEKIYKDTYYATDNRTGVVGEYSYFYAYVPSTSFKAVIIDSIRVAHNDATALYISPSLEDDFPGIALGGFVNLVRNTLSWSEKRPFNFGDSVLSRKKLNGPAVYGHPFNRYVLKPQTLSSPVIDSDFKNVPVPDHGIILSPGHGLLFSTENFNVSIHVEIGFTEA